jgi:hypothetical protein
VPSALFYVVESTCNPLTVTAEVASSSLVVPAIFFKDLQLGRCFIWVQQGCTGFRNRCHPHFYRQYGFDQLRLGRPLRVRRRLQILVRHAEIVMTQVVAGRQLMLAQLGQ